MENNHLHILILASWYKTNELSTYGSFIEEQARLLLNQGNKVILVHPYLKGTFLGTLKNRKTEISIIDDSGLLTFRIGVSPVFPKMQGLTYLKLNRIVQKTMGAYYKKHGKPDLIHSHALFMGGIVGRYLSKKIEIPLFHTEHTSGLIFNPKQYTKRDIDLLKKTYESSKKVFFVSNFALEKVSDYLNLNKENFKTLPNLVNDSFFTSISQKNEKPFEYLMISDFIEIKNHELLIYAWKLFHNHYPNSKLTLIGEGEKKEEIVLLARELKIDHSIKWMDRQNRKEIKHMIDQHHVVLSTSKLETFGLTVAEALASGKPVVVTDSGGIRDIVNSENGIITEQDVDSFSKGLIQMQENYSSYDCSKIQKDIKIKFSENSIYHMLMSEYLEK